MCGNCPSDRSLNTVVTMSSCLLSALLLIAATSLTHANPLLPAAEIVRRAHEAAGGELWTRPQSLYLVGTSTFFEGNSPNHFDSHEMWRIYPASKASAHQADGKVRIRSSQNGVTRLDLAFDGQRTRVNGNISDEASDSRRWASNFGFGVIRHALDPGYTLMRLADDQVDGTPSFTIRVIDPEGSDTIFGIAITSYEILMVGFDTPRGWHQRIYSGFFSKPNSRWNQPGLVRLYYDGVKQNEVRWTDFQVNIPFAAQVFQFPSEGSEND